MPNPSHSTAPQVGASRTKLMLIALLCLAPIVLAWTLYFVRGHWSFATTNVGHLLPTPLTLSELPLQITATPRNPQPTALPKKWLLVYLGSPNCDQQCTQQLTELAQIHLALGKDTLRVSRVLTLSQYGQHLNQRLVEQYPYLIQTVASQSALAAVRQKLHIAKDSPALLIADPIGNIVLYYDTDLPVKGVLKDMKHLLKVSRIG